MHLEPISKEEPVTYGEQLLEAFHVMATQVLDYFILMKQVLIVKQVMWIESQKKKQKYHKSRKFKYKTRVSH